MGWGKQIGSRNHEPLPCFDKKHVQLLQCRRASRKVACDAGARWFGRVHACWRRGPRNKHPTRLPLQAKIGALPNGKASVGRGGEGGSRLSNNAL